MDFKALLPDFNAIKNTDWTKPQVDTKDTLSLVTLGCIALMLIFVFLPWFSMTAEGETASRLGITTVCGIFGFILTLAAAAGAVYKHYTLSFSASVIALIFGLIGCFVVTSLSKDGMELSKDMVKAAIQADKLAEAFGKDVLQTSHLGAILFTLASAGTAVVSYLKITKK